jgi:undecaprenyl phosphate N,N'-diacetylbacillosamine 1-phosphate transferase
VYKFFFKRVFDLSVSLTLLLLLSPLLTLVIIFLFFANQGKVFFIQERPGKNERIFKIVKFKTMNDKKDNDGKLLPDISRLTPIGIIVRKTSLDEMPQLLNVIKGDMSLIGPRPLLIKYLPYFTETERLRHTVKPGITGLAQVSGRNTVRWNDRLALDVAYIKDISFTNDIRILLKTVANAMTSKDIVVDAESIMLNLDDERKIRDSVS